MLHLHPFPSHPKRAVSQRYTCLDSIFGGQIKNWLWGVPRDGGILPDPSGFWGFEWWQEFALSSGAVGCEDH